ncbi:hypothetical protein PRIEUP_LOCUS11913 [Pristimantis euphronides]
MTPLFAAFLVYYVVLQVSAVLLPPRNLKLASKNFKHILTWEDSNNESSIYYCVQCSKMMGPFETVKHCSNITTRHCDLTKHLINIRYTYEVRVLRFTDHDSSKPSTAVYLVPVQNTVLGPPVVDLTLCDGCIKLSIRSPDSHLWNEKEQKYVSLFTAYRVLYYKIQLMDMNGEVSSSTVTISTEIYTLIQPNLLPNANFCVSVTVTAPVNNNSVPSKLKCVVTESLVNGSSTIIIVGVAFAVLFVIVLVLGLFVLDHAGYICRAKTLIPKVLKSIPTSESAFIDGNEFTSPTFSTPEEIITKKFEVEQKAQTEVKTCEGGGYASRKRLPGSDESDTSGTATSGDFPSAVSSSAGSSTQANSSAEEDLSAGHQGDGVPSATSHLGISSIVHLPVIATENSSNPPFDNCGVFNINLNSVAIADPADVWTGFRQVEAPLEEAENSMESHKAGVALVQHNAICLDVDLEEEYCSDYEEEEDDISENDDSDSHLISSDYMRR